MTCSQNSRGRKGERPVGVPAAHGHWGDGGADIRGALESPEHDSVCLWRVAASIGRSAQFGPVRKYSKGGSWQFRCWLRGWRWDVKGFNTERTEEKRREIGENQKLYRREAECAAKGKGEAAGLTLWQAGAQQAPSPTKPCAATRFRRGISCSQRRKRQRGRQRGLNGSARGGRLAEAVASTPRADVRFELPVSIHGRHRNKTRSQAGCGSASLGIGAPTFGGTG